MRGERNKGGLTSGEMERSNRSTRGNRTGGKTLRKILQNGKHQVLFLVIESQSELKRKVVTMMKKTEVDKKVKGGKREGEREQKSVKYFF